MIYLEMAEGYVDENDEDKERFWIQKAYDNSNCSLEIQEIIKNSKYGEQKQQLIDQIWEIIYKRFEEKMI